MNIETYWLLVPCVGIAIPLAGFLVLWLTSRREIAHLGEEGDWVKKGLIRPPKR